jgi:adenylate cyclase
MKRWLDLAIPFALLLAALALRAEEGPGVLRLRNFVFDNYQRLEPRPYVDAPVTIVDIDEDSLARLGQWPWPRSRLAELVDRLKGQGAAAIALDILLSEPDRTAPENLVALWPDAPGLDGVKRAILQLPDPDVMLAQSLANAPAVVGFELTGRGHGAPPLKAGFAQAGDDPKRFLPRYAGVVRARPEFEAAATGYGSVNVVPDSDGTARRLPLLLAVGDGLVPSFAAEALRVAQGARSYVVKASGASGEASFGAATGIVAIRIGAAVVPTDANGRLVLYDSGHRPERFVPAWQAIAGENDPSRIAGRIVLIGSTAEGLKDLKPTPLAPTMAGVEVTAQALEQMTTGVYLGRPDWADGAEILFLLVFGSALILAARRFSAVGGALLGLGAATIAIGGSWLAFAQDGWLVDPLFPTAMALLLYLATSFLGYLRTESEKRHVRAVFSQYLSPVLVEKLASRPEPPSLGGEMRELTLMFSDLQGFTSIAEGLDPEELTRLMNRFLTPMTRVIQNRLGTIDKYMGDCIMAFWNAPLDDPDHAAHALEAALAMRAELARLNAELAKEAAARGSGPMGLAFGIGINTGRCSVGNMGSEQRIGYTAIGDAVNLASRLEGLARLYGIDCVVGEATAKAAGGHGFALLEIDRVRVKGKRIPEAVHALLGDRAMAEGEAFRALGAAHRAVIEAYRACDWEGATAALQQARDRLGTDFVSLIPLYALYEQRIAEFRAHPPPADWDGVHAAVGKSG